MSSTTPVSIAPNGSSGAVDVGNGTGEKNDEDDGDEVEEGGNNEGN